MYVAGMRDGATDLCSVSTTTGRDLKESDRSNKLHSTEIDQNPSARLQQSRFVSRVTERCNILNNDCSTVSDNATESDARLRSTSHHPLPLPAYSISNPTNPLRHQRRRRGTTSVQRRTGTRRIRHLSRISRIVRIIPFAREYRDSILPR